MLNVHSLNTLQAYKHIQVNINVKVKHALSIMTSLDFLKGHLVRCSLHIQIDLAMSIY